MASTQRDSGAELLSEQELLGLLDEDLLSEVFANDPEVQQAHSFLASRSQSQAPVRRVRQRISQPRPRRQQGAAPISESEQLQESLGGWGSADEGSSDAPEHEQTTFEALPRRRRSHAEIMANRQRDWQELSSKLFRQRVVSAAVPCSLGLCSARRGKLLYAALIVTWPMGPHCFALLAIGQSIT